MESGFCSTSFWSLCRSFSTLLLSCVTSSAKPVIITQYGSFPKVYNGLIISLNVSMKHNWGHKMLRSVWLDSWLKKHNRRAPKRINKGKATYRYVFNNKDYLIESRSIPELCKLWHDHLTGLFVQWNQIWQFKAAKIFNKVSRGKKWRLTTANFTVANESLWLYFSPSVCIIACVFFPESTKSYGDEIIVRRKKKTLWHSWPAVEGGGELSF